MELACVTPFFQKENWTNKENYRPISILSHLSKVFERCSYNQLSVFFDEIRSKYQCSFRKGFNVQYCFINLLETWRQSLNQFFFSKAFDYLSHELLVAKLIAYGVEISSLRLIYDYLINRKQRTKIGYNYSSYRDIISRVRHASILGPVVFNIYICDMFFLFTDMHVGSYADDTSPYIYVENQSIFY